MVHAILPWGELQDGQSNLMAQAPISGENGHQEQNELMTIMTTQTSTGRLAVTQAAAIVHEVS